MPDSGNLCLKISVDLCFLALASDINPSGPQFPYLENEKIGLYWFSTHSSPLIEHHRVPTAVRHLRCENGPLPQ